MIEVESLVKEFRLTKEQRKEYDVPPAFVRAVEDVSFTCNPGRIFSLIGPNGAGKTTCLRIIATILKPSAGAVRVAGYDVLQEPRQVKKKLGFLTGATGLYDRLTPNELVKYFADLYSMEKSAFNEQKEKLFTLLDINSYANKRIGKLSTGMKQRVSIARTMIHDPEIVIFDEPTAGLDVISASSIIELIRNCKQEGKTVLFSTHIMGEVELLCDDLAIIHKGRLQFHGTFGDFKQQMESVSLVEEFIRIIKAA